MLMIDKLHQIPGTLIVSYSVGKLIFDSTFESAHDSLPTFFHTYHLVRPAEFHELSLMNNFKT